VISDDTHLICVIYWYCISWSVAGCFST